MRLFKGWDVFDLVSTGRAVYSSWSMPVVYVSNGDKHVSILLKAGKAMTSEGLWHKPSISAYDGTSHDTARLARVPWGRCVLIQQWHIFLNITCRDDMNRAITVQFTSGKQKEMQGRLERLVRSYKVRKQGLAVAMAMHPRLGAGSRLAGLGDNLLSLVVRLLHI